MNVMNKDVVVTRPYKVVYREGDQIIKVFTPEHGKASRVLKAKSPTTNARAVRAVRTKNHAQEQRATAR